MRVPLSWLREFVDVDVPDDELFELMGRNGLEIEEVRRPGGDIAGVRLARVLDVSEHPDADKLVVATVHDGEGERTVLAGARNMQADDIVPLALPGATLPTADGGTFEISRREMRGITSDGMLCSARELQVADDHSGIMVLGRVGEGGEGMEPGTDVREVLPLGEPVMDVAVPADRGDLHSVYGIARDLAAILGVDVAPAPAPAENGDTVRGDYGDVPVKVIAHDGCSRYVGWAVEGLRVAPSPWWLRRRLEVCGVRSISNLVDVTNYVMLELGQPLHAFDVERLRGPEIVVRWAEPGEELTTLDGQLRELEPDDLVIADAGRAVALAGVMGGEDTEVGPATTDVLLEAASFDPAAIRRTSRRLNLVSQASMRFERRVDPEGSWQAAARAVDLLAELAGGRDAGVRVGGEGDPPPATIRLDPAWTTRFLGLDELPGDRQAELLRRAGIEVTEDGDAIEATPPTWRGDLTRPADLVEEIARLHGYERIPATLPPLALRGGLDRRQRAEQRVRDAAVAAGLHEAHTSPFVSPDALTLLVPDDAWVRLQNPVAKDSDTMRPGLVEGLLASARRNVGQGREGAALFEVGRIFRQPGGRLEDAVSDPLTGRWAGHDGGRLPFQPVAIGAVAYGWVGGRDWLDRTRPWDLFDLLGLLDEVSRRLTPESSPLVREPGEHAALHPGRTASLRWAGAEIGVAGQLHPDEAARRDLPDGTVIAELVLDPLWAHLRGSGFDARQAPELARHQAMGVDVAVVADDDLSYARIEGAVRSGAGRLLDGLWWFDEYRGEQLGEGRRSLAFHLRLQAHDRQLTDADAEDVIDGVADAVGGLGAELRR